jgi:hypothetical protein
MIVGITGWRCCGSGRDCDTNWKKYVALDSCRVGLQRLKKLAKY